MMIRRLSAVFVCSFAAFAAAADDLCVLIPLDAPALTVKANAGNADAQYLLAMRAAFPEDAVQQDDAKAVDWARKAAEQGMPEAQYLLGWLYGVREPLGLDRTTAETAVQQAADAGLPEAQRAMALLLLRKDAKNPASALALLRRAANQGDADAQLLLSAIHTLRSIGDDENASEEEIESHRWLLIAQNNATDPGDRQDIQEMLDDDKAELTAEQLAEAEKRAAAFAVKPERPVRACVTPMPKVKK